MQLQMLAGPETAAPPGSGHVEISGITADSRQVQPGWLFAAMPGAKADGARFVPEAIAKGAAAILVKTRHRGRRAGACAVLSIGRAAPGAGPDGRALLPGPAGQRSSPSPAPAARPRSPTSRARSSPRSATRPPRSAPSASSSPTAASTARSPRPIPWPCTRRWRSWRREGVTHLAFEASSHGLDQHRLDGVRLKAAAFTNLGRDHLDYHPTWRPISRPSCACSPSCCRPTATAVVNADAEHAAQVIAAAQEPRSQPS